MMRPMPVLIALLLIATPAIAQQEMLIDGFEAPNPGQWGTGGQKEISFSFDDAHVIEGRQALHIHVEIDHHDVEFIEGESYPRGWPSVDVTYDPPIDLSDYDFLEFDVYFESADGEDPGFAMQVTTRDDQDRDIYRARLIDLRHGQWAHEKLCIRDIDTAGAFANVHFWLSEDNYDHGDVIDFWIDNLRATKASDYEAPEPAPVRHAVHRADFATLWQEGSATKVMRSEPLDLPAGADPHVSISAARNETEAAQLVLSTDAADGPGEIALEIGELTGPDGATVSAEHITWSPVVNIPANEGPPEGLPDALPGPEPFVADGPGNRPIWLEVYVPPGTPAGDYAAPVTVHTGEGDLEATLTLHVWDFAIPVKQSLRTSTTIYGYWGFAEEINGWFGDQDWNDFVNEFRPMMIELLARYRLCPANVGHLGLDWDEDEQAVVISSTAEFERTAEQALALGHHIDTMPVPYFFNRDSFLGAEKGTDEYLDRIEQAYRVAAEYLDKAGWLEGSYVYPADEMVVHRHSREENMELLNTVLERIKSAHPGIQLFGAEIPSPVLYPLDIYCINMSAFDPDVLKEQRSLGHDVWWYNGYVDPRAGTRVAARGVDHRALFWMNYKYDIDGYLIWTVNRWRWNPWEQPNAGSSPAGTYFLLYPNPDGTISPSIRICMMRDGLEDYEYHVLLDDLADQLRGAGDAALADECERIIEQADSFILAFDNCAHIEAEYIYASRRIIAEQIEKATAALED